MYRTGGVTCLKYRVRCGVCGFLIFGRPKGVKYHKDCSKGLSACHVSFAGKVRVLRERMRDKRFLEGGKE